MRIWFYLREQARIHYKHLYNGNLWPNVSFYTLKTALHYLVARRLCKEKIRINSVSPGMVAMDLSRNTCEEHTQKCQEMQERVPLKRRGQPEDIAAAVYFLASEDASG